MKGIRDRGRKEEASDCIFRYQERLQMKRGAKVTKLLSYIVDI